MNSSKIELAMPAEPAKDTVVANQIDIRRIMEMLPHRYPFLMLDRIAEFVPDDSAIGIKSVTINEPFFQGHFPDHPVMPGVLLIEAMAQTAAVLVVASVGDAAKGKIVYFMSVEKARFRRPVVPGDRLHIHVQKQRSRGLVWKFHGRIAVDGRDVAEATFSAMVKDD